MKSVGRCLLNGFTGWMHGISAKRMGVYAAATGLLLGVSAPLSARADSITQGECLQWLVQACGDTGQFASGATAADLVQWARNKGINPTGGWQPNAILTREALAEIVAQLIGVNGNGQKKGVDYVRLLEREGITIAATPEITR